MGHSMVLRGGFGISTYAANTGPSAGLQNAPYSFNGGCQNPNVGGGGPGGPQPSCTGNYALPGGGWTFAGSIPLPSMDLTLATDRSKYQQLRAVDFNFRSSYLYQYSLQIEKELAGNVLTVGYVGSLGRHLPIHPNVNQPANSTKPYPFGDLRAGVETLLSQANSTYNAMQVTLARRLSKGLVFSTNYTWSHIIDQAGAMSEGEGGSMNCYGSGCLVDNVANPAQPIVVNGWQEYDRGTGDLDVRQRISVTFNYQLPFGKSLSGVAGQIIKGWAFNAAASYATGMPFTVSNGTRGPGSAISGLQVRDERINMIADWHVDNPTIAQWFNVKAFKKQTSGTFGNEGRNVLVGPPNRKLDVSLAKEFLVREPFRLQFRFEAFNVTNTPNFNQPGVGVNRFDDSGVATNTGGFGAITSTSPTATPRQMQLGLKLVW
jgi:hypothetical protein